MQDIGCKLSYARILFSKTYELIHISWRLCSFAHPYNRRTTELLVVCPAALTVTRKHLCVFKAVFFFVLLQSYLHQLLSFGYVISPSIFHAEKSIWYNQNLFSLVQRKNYTWLCAENLSHHFFSRKIGSSIP